MDWEKVEAIMIVLQFNLGYVSTREGGVFPLPMWEKPFLGCTPYSTVEQVKHCPSLHCDRPARQSPDSAFLNIGSITFTNGITESSLGPPPSLLKQPSLPTDLKDPYAITGTWMRVVCFLDYSELYNLNFDLDEEFHYTLDEKPDYDPSWTEEAVRMIVMRLKVTKLRAPNPDNGEIDYKGMPVAEFIGSSHSLHTAWDSNANSMIRGIRGPSPFLSPSSISSDLIPSTSSIYLPLYHHNTPYPLPPQSIINPFVTYTYDTTLTHLPH